MRQIRNFGNLERRILKFNVFAKEIYILKVVLVARRRGVYVSRIYAVVFSYCYLLTIAFRACVTAPFRIDRMGVNIVNLRFRT